ncbi:protein BASIC PENTACYSTEINE6-like [Diospyros lotus]|uniref:protein BASIC PENTACYSTEINE6-like n=1 Tax=Diospyros lotus TaxID=55363 RepID=UPI002259170F|nr:protein BASIC PENTACYSTEINE6-like [Diospyros lotus]XP_052195684.1 protein BASIC PENTACYSTEINE6-like [Diospyros lotus]XP_052195685.1 protein BASIC PENTACYSTEINE6-like [Diospyros lotus]XP_052195686.1 protein BASIC PENTACYSTEINE6-like [Diospyros lotus]XP_052195687.1 protein BASIC PENTACYSTEINE6-like [Diospyros lotus]
MEQNFTMKTYMAIMAERDAAIRERNIALDERRRAFAERDMAMLQRDAALAERNSALEERDKALSALKFRESSMNEDNTSLDPLGNETVDGGEHLYHQQIPITQLGDPKSNPLHCGEATKPKKVKQAKETRGASAKSSRPQRRGKKGAEGLSHLVGVAASNEWENEQKLGGQGKDLEEQVMLREHNLGVDQLDLDKLPTPVCSCTGVPQPCYEWGNGGWQSVCCTATAAVCNHQQTTQWQVGGRKMSGNAFVELLTQLASAGHDLSTPLDLKDHWPKNSANANYCSSVK